MQHLIRGKPRFGYFLIFIVGISLASIWSLIRWPMATLHDEFSYLLAADTFANLRWTNIAPERWEHFESFHILVRPSYCSKYPPGLAAFLAIGQSIYNPAIGLWLAAGFAAVCMFYAARAVSSARISCLTTLLLVLNPAAHAYWSVKFMPGWPTIGFSALVLGGVLRLNLNPRSAKSALLAGLGIVGLALTRPFEGFILVVVTVLTAVWLWNRKNNPHCETTKPILIGRFALLTLTATLTLGAALAMYYNMQTTGQPTRFAYQLHEKQYGLAPLLLFLQPPDEIPHYHHKELQHFHQQMSLHGFNELKKPSRYFTELTTRIYRSVQIIGVAPILLAMLAFSRRFEPRLVLPLTTFFAGISLLLIIPWMMPHYLATAIPGLLLLCSRGLKLLIAKARQQLPRRRYGIGQLVIIIFVILQYGMSVGAYSINPRVPKFAIERQRVLTKLMTESESSIVFVKYLPGHDINHEWVYNASDLQSSHVIWARSMGTDRDLKTARILNRRAYKLSVGASDREQSIEPIDYSELKRE